jgi:hypothetical protein
MPQHTIAQAFPEWTSMNQNGAFPRASDLMMRGATAEITKQ